MVFKHINHITQKTPDYETGTVIQTEVFLVSSSMFFLLLQNVCICIYQAASTRTGRELEKRQENSLNILKRWRFQSKFISLRSCKSVSVKRFFFSNPMIMSVCSISYAIHKGRYSTELSSYHYRCITNLRRRNHSSDPADSALITYSDSQSLKANNYDTRQNERTSFLGVRNCESLIVEKPKIIQSNILTQHVRKLKQTSYALNPDILTLVFTTLQWSLCQEKCSKQCDRK